tara:strand:- start:2308 stop:10632 length:8325 start_codon:yes stop_codon:yes gene_type:complete
MAVLFPDGNFYNIEGLDPNKVAKLYKIMEQEEANRKVKKIESDKSFLGRGIELLGSGTRELVGSTAEGIQTLGDIATGSTEQDTFLRNLAESQREKARDITPIKPIQEAESAGDVVGSGLAYLTQSVPEMGVILGSAAAGAKIGASVAPIHPVAKLVGGLVGGTIGGLVPFLGRNTEEFREVKGRNPNRGEAAALLGTAGVQSALNSVIATVTPLVKPLKGLTSGSQGAIRNAIKRGVQGTVIEGSTEASQDILQILAANDFNTDVLKEKENVFRVTESLLAGATIGGGLGTVTGAFTADPATNQEVEETKKFAEDLASIKPILKLEDLRGTEKEQKKLTAKKIKPKKKGEKALETEADVDPLDVEAKRLFNKDLQSLTPKQKDQILRSAAQTEAINELGITDTGRLFEKIGKEKVDPITKDAVNLSRTITDEEQRVLREYKPLQDKKYLDLVNSKIKKSVVVSRDDKGKTTFVNLTNNELVDFAKSSSDDVILNIANSDLTTENKAIRIADYLDKNATPRLNDIGVQQSARRPVLNADGTQKVGPDGVPMFQDFEYSSVFYDLTTEELEARMGAIGDPTQDVSFYEKDLYYSSERTPYFYADPKTGKKKAYEPTLSGRLASAKDPVGQPIFLPDEKVQEQTQEDVDPKIKVDPEGTIQRGIEDKREPVQLEFDYTRGSIRLQEKPSPRLEEDGTVNQEETQRIEDVERGAIEYFENRLERLAKRGKQGQLLANSLRYQVIKPTVEGARFNPITGETITGRLTGSQIAGAFLAADEIVNTLGAEGNTELHFLNILTADKQVLRASAGADVGTERTLKGEATYKPIENFINRRGDDANGKIKSLIKLAWMDEEGGFTPEEYAQTAAHEAFHVLQDVYSVADPKARSLLNGAFDVQGRGYKKLPSRIKRLIKKYDPDTHQMLMDGDVKFDTAEMQAIVFENFKKAQLEGVNDPLGGILGSYFNFVTRFLGRFRNAMQGAGFRTVEDIIESAAKGEMEQQVADVSVESRADARKKELETTDPEENWGTVNQEFSSRGSMRPVKTPVKTQTFYKVLRTKDNDVYSLFVDSDQSMGEIANPENNKFFGANPDVFKFAPDIIPGSDKKGKKARPNTKGELYVPTGLGKGKRQGESVPVPEGMRDELFKKGFLKTRNQKTVSVVKFRPGIHAARFPEADHIKDQFTRDDYRWFEVEVADDTSVELENKARENAELKKDGTINQRTKYLEEIPEGGFYTYTTNANADTNNEWIITGAMKIGRMLEQQEIDQIRKDNGLKPSPKSDLGRGSIRIKKIQKELNLSDPNKFPLNPEFDEIQTMFGLSDNARRLSGLDLLYPPESKKYIPTNKKEEKFAVKEIGNALQTLADKVLDGKLVNITDDPSTVSENEMLSRTLAAFAYVVKQKNPDSAIDWYTKSIDETINTVSLIHPEVKTNKDHRRALSMAIAVTSQGVEVERNANIGLAVYEEWKATGKFPEYGEGESKQAMIKNFRLANKVNDILTQRAKEGKSDLSFFDFLDLGKEEVFTVTDLKKFLNDAGFTTTDNQAIKKTGNKKAKADIKLTGENSGSRVYGSYLLGAKIGNGFYQNLMGNFIPITMDMWFMRTWGRLTGTLVGKPKAYRNNLKQIVEELKAIKKGDREVLLSNKNDSDQILDFADTININRDTDAIVDDLLKDDATKQNTFNMMRDIESINQRWYKSNAFLDDKQKVPNPKFNSDDRPQLFKSNTNAIKNGLSTIDGPRNGTDREWMRSTVNRAREILENNEGDAAYNPNRERLNLTSADFQALIWYPEKDIFRLLSEGKKETLRNISYSEAFGDPKKGIIGDGTRYKSIRTNKPGELFSVVQPDKRGESDREPERNPNEQASVSDSELGRGSIRLKKGDVTSGIKEVIAGVENQQGVLPNTLQDIKFQVLKYLSPFNLANKKNRDKFVDEFISGLEPVARLERAVRKKLEAKFPSLAKDFSKTPGKLLSYERGAFKAIELTQQMAARIQAVAEKGAPVLNDDGTVGVAQGTKGLFEIFKPIGQSGNYARYQLYTIAKRASRLKGEKRENLLTEAQIIEGLSYENDVFRKVHKEHQEFNDKLMQFLVDSGAISQEKKDDLVGTSDYVPFHRIIDEEAYENGLFGQVRKPNKANRGTTSAFDDPDAYVRNVMRPLKGGTAKIGDLYTNVFANAQAIIGAGLKNIAMQKTVKLMEEAKELGYYENMDNPPSFVDKKGDNNFSYRENGEVKYYDVGDDADIITALRTFTPIQMQGFLKVMQNMARIFRNLITITPGFMLANLYRGELAGFVTVDAPITPVVDGLKGLRNVLNQTETAEEMKLIGGFGGYTFGESNENFSAKMKRMYRRHEGYDIIDTPTKLKDMTQNLMDKINTFGEATELATREGIYRRLVESGVPKADAAYEALNLINYNRRGNPQGVTAQTLQMLIPLIPFLNARIQGLYRTGTALSGTESKAKNTFFKGMTYLGLSLGVYAVMSQNEDWEKEPLYRKLNYHIIYAGDKKFLIPKPFEIGAIFSTMPELLLDSIAQKDGKIVRDGVLQILINNFQLNPIPQAVKPLLEIGVNKDFFKGRELESLGQRGLPTAQRAYSTTSQFAQLAGQATATIGISPIEFEQLVNGYTGSMGALILGMFDAFLGATGAVPQRPAGLFGDNPLSDTAELIGLSRFYKERGEGDPANKFLGEFYDLKREADQLLRGINNLREKGNIEAALEMKKENRALLGSKRQLNRMFQQINEINDRIQGIKQRDLDQTQKRNLIRQLTVRRNRIAEGVVRIKERIRRAA